MSRTHVSILMVAMVVTACSSDDEGAAPGSEATAPATTEATDDFVAPEWEPSTRAEELAWEMSTSPDGATLQHAIDSFGLLDPDFPAVTPSDLPPGDAIGDTSTLALILSMRDELSAEQRARLDEYLAGDTLVGRVSPDGEIEVTGSPPATSEAAGWRPSGLPPVADYPALLAEMRQAWIDHLADAPGHIYELWITNQEPSGGMDAHASDENPDVCMIRVNPEFAFANPSDDKIRWWLAHELFHCMQFRWAAAASFWNPHRWVTEGSADWAVADLFRNRQNDAGFLYEEWFVEAYRPLAGREYDAWPLYESAARNGNDVYGSIIRMMREPTAAVVPMLAVGHLDGLISRIDWATRALRDLAYGQDWWLDWPLQGRESSGPTKTSAVAGPLGLGTRTFGGQGRFSQQVWTVQWTSDVDLVTVFPTGSPLVTSHRSRHQGRPGRIVGTVLLRPWGLCVPECRRRRIVADERPLDAGHLGRIRGAAARPRARRVVGSGGTVRRARSRSGLVGRRPASALVRRTALRRHCARRVRPGARPRRRLRGADAPRLHRVWHGDDRRRGRRRHEPRHVHDARLLHRRAHDGARRRRGRHGRGVHGRRPARQHRPQPEHGGVAGRQHGRVGVVTWAGS